MEYRFNEHIKDAKHGSTNHFHKAIRKYGKDGFISEILEENLTEQVAFDNEIVCINNHNSYTHGYNMTLGGDRGPILHGAENGMYGKRHSDSAKKAMSDAKKLLIGKKHPHYGKTSPLKGKSYEEQFGKDKANKLKEERSKLLNGIKRPYNMGKNNPAKREDVRKKISATKSNPIIINNVTYMCKKDACNKLNISLYKLNKLLGEKNEVDHR